MKQQIQEVLKGGNQDMEMKTEIVTFQRKIFKDKCPVCGKEIRGTKESQVNHNMKIHMMTHAKDENGKE